MGAQHEITVRVVSPEEADHGVAEFWVGLACFWHAGRCSNPCRRRSI
jgi:hypothetical protein